MSDVNIDHIEALVGPLPRRREWERWCEYTQPLSLPERGKADAALAELKAENEALRRQVEALKVCGNCNHWWSGLMGCAMDSSQAVVCEGFDHCKVFTQLADKPETREPCWTDRKQDR